MKKMIVLSLLCISSCFANIQEPNEVLEYWFGCLTSVEDYPANKIKLWFNGGEAVDNEIRDRFGCLVQLASRHELDGWKETAKGRLALIILLDQFPRNIYRGTPQAFAYDSLAQEMTLEGIKKGDDLVLFPIERVFFYLPLEHAENLELQKISLEKYHSILEDVPVNQVSHFEGFEDYAKKHEVIIARFGHFPHRNKILNRESTLEEVEFLKGPNSSF